MPVECLHRHQVNDALEILFGTDGQLNGARIGPEDLANLAHYVQVVAAHAIHLVDIGNAGHLVLVGLTPHGLALGLYSADSAEGGDSAIQHAKRTLHLDGEVHMPRSVNQVNLVLATVIVPERGRCSAGDGDSPLLLLLHPVHGCGTLMNLSHLMGQARVVQDTLRCGGLAGINVRHDADVACIFQLCVSAHCQITSSLNQNLK